MKLRILLSTLFTILVLPLLYCQEDVLDDNTRATLILDIAKYVKYDHTFDELEEFSITVLDKDDKFYWSLERMARERELIQGKPIKIYLLPKIGMLSRTQVIYVNNDKGYDIGDLFHTMQGWNTLVVSEGYDFNESMINFRMYNGRPRFDANEMLMKKHRLSVDELFLAQAIKTREDWEKLYKVTDEELQVEKEITQFQDMLIAEQDSMIDKQVQRLEVLGDQIMERESELEEKEEALVEAAGELQEKISSLVRAEKELEQKNEQVSEQESEIKSQQLLIEQKQVAVDDKNRILEDKTREIAEKEEKIAFQVEILQRQRIVLFAALIALLLLVSMVYVIFINYRNKKKANQLLEEKNVEITAQRDEIEKRKELAEMQRDQIAYQKKHITDSILYAQRIQRAILPSLELFTDELEHFVLYKPRDIVSGDFYWVDKVHNKQVIIAADCTGHGVPGAFMSMLGISLLNEIILNRNIIEPHEVLNKLREMVIESLSQGEGLSDVKDGMDMTVCLLDFEKDLLYYAGANNPLYHIHDGELTQYKADKMPVGIHEQMGSFHSHAIKLVKGDTFYTFSDGFADQFGGPKQKKFLSKNFRKVLLDHQHLPMIDQGKKLDEIFEEYRADVEQVDDVVVIGIRY